MHVIYLHVYIYFTKALQISDYLWKKNLIPLIICCIHCNLYTSHVRAQAFFMENELVCTIYVYCIYILVMHYQGPCYAECLFNYTNWLYYILMLFLCRYPAKFLCPANNVWKINIFFDYFYEIQPEEFLYRFPLQMGTWKGWRRYWKCVNKTWRTISNRSNFVAIKCYGKWLMSHKWENIQTCTKLLHILSLTV